MKIKRFDIGVKTALVILFSCFLAGNVFAEEPVLEGEILVSSEVTGKTPSTSKRKKNKEEESISGWKTPSGNSIDQTIGSIRLRAKIRKGTFNIGVIDDRTYRTIPVLNTSDEYISTGFYLKAGDKIINLNTDTRVKYTGWKTDTGMVLGYRVENIADVMVYFDCFQSDSEYDIDTMKVTVTVTNTGKKRSKFAVKAVLDTVLGETDRHHFYNYENHPVKNEIGVRKFNDFPWLISKNSAASMQLILNGGEATAPELLALANYSTLAGRTWEPDLLSYRTFDTVLAYDNSACGLIWPAKNLSVKEQSSDVFYISLSVGDRLPSGAAFIGAGSAEDSVSEEILSTKTVQYKNEGLDAGVKSDVKTDSVSEEVAPVEKQNSENEKSVLEENNSAMKVPYVEFDVQTLTREQLSSDYIQKLLNRIAELEETDSSLNRDELDRLNAELDAILEAIRM